MPGRAAQFWQSGTVPRPPVAAVSAVAAHGPASSPHHCQAPLPRSQWGVSALGGAGARGDSSHCRGPSPSTFPAGRAPWCAPCLGSVADEWLPWLEVPSASGDVCPGSVRPEGMGRGSAGAGGTGGRKPIPACWLGDPLHLGATEGGSGTRLHAWARAAPTHQQLAALQQPLSSSSAGRAPRALVQRAAVGWLAALTAGQGWLGRDGSWLMARCGMGSVQCRPPFLARLGRLLAFFHRARHCSPRLGACCRLCLRLSWRLQQCP